ncbi:MAG TPA: A24 family peptidase [Candidatus Krumholzibacteria bacterium]|nr:A24 family peptidase [Candidatus Krumholzibacteria bacterium]
MYTTTMEVLSAILIAVVVGTAIVTDVRSRRIPNTLTFPALLAALVVRFAFQGWAGLGLALLGAIIAPLILLIVHLGKGIGMGDLKLAAAVGAFLGPAGAVAAMLASAILGGVLAMALLMQRGQLLAEFFSLFAVGVPFLKRKHETKMPANTSPLVTTMPYGVAIAIGTLSTLAGYAWLGSSLPSFAQIAARL